jgi:hypothetical protein
MQMRRQLRIVTFRLNSGSGTFAIQHRGDVHGSTRAPQEASVNHGNPSDRTLVTLMVTRDDAAKGEHP